MSTILFLHTTTPPSKVLLYALEKFCFKIY